MRVLLADDHVVVRQGLKALLEGAGFTVVGEASDGREAVAVAGRTDADVAVLDLMMPGLNGIDAAQAMRRSLRRIKPVVLTVHPEDEYVLAALRAGVRGYVLKTQASAELVHAIGEVAAGRKYFSPCVSAAVVEAFFSNRSVPPEALTARQREVLQLIAEGKTTKAIAAILSVSVKTAESHRMNLMQKLDIHEVAGLVRYAIRRGLVRP